MTLEKEIPEEIGMKEGDKLTYEGTKKTILLTQSKIIQIIDKRILKHDRALQKLKKKNDELYQKLADGDSKAGHKMDINDRAMSMIKSSKEELQSLKKSLLEPEKEEKLGFQVATENVDPNSSSENSKGEEALQHFGRKIEMIDFKYNEISAIRNLLQRMRLHIWKEDWLPKFKNADISIIQKNWNWFISEKNIFYDFGMLNIILEKIDKYEEDIKKQLGG